MSASTSPLNYAEDAFTTDAHFKVEIEQKMKVPDRISFTNADLNGGTTGAWQKDNLDMQVPERILVAGQDQHVGTRAPPREIVFDNSILPTEPYADVRVATPPRTLTLDKYPFPGLNETLTDEDDDGDDNVELKDKIPVVRRKGAPGGRQVSYRESGKYVNNPEGLTPAEEVLHLRKQMSRLNRRVMALESDNVNRLQKEKLIVGMGLAYLLLKVLVWLGRD